MYARPKNGSAATLRTEAHAKSVQTMAAIAGQHQNVDHVGMDPGGTVHDLN